MTKSKKQRRHLTPDEKKLVRKNITLLEEELEYKEKVDLAKIQLVLDTAELSVKKQIKEKEYEKRKTEEEINELRTSIKILRDQLRNGVEVKDSK